MKTILVPLDGSSLAEQALPYARLLAPILGARVRLLRAISAAERADLLAHRVSQGQDSALAPPVCEQCSFATQCAHTNCYIAAQATRLRAAGVEADADIHAGGPTTVIATVAKQLQNPLVAMTTHGRRGLRRWARGSVADRIVHDTALPLLLVRGSERRPPTEPQLRRILVPLDGSPLSHLALPFAIELALRAHAELTGLWVLAASMDTYLRDFPVAADARRALLNQLNEALTAYAGDCPSPMVQITATVAIGPTAEVIVEEAERRRADLIVMATHGYIGLQRWRLGSTADRVRQATKIPLLLIRDPMSRGT